MIVIIREEVKLGSGMDIHVYEYEDEYQLGKCVDEDANWFNKVHIPIDEMEVYDDEAIICGGDYSISYYVKKVERR